MKCFASPLAPNFSAKMIKSCKEWSMVDGRPINYHPLQTRSRWLTLEATFCLRVILWELYHDLIHPLPHVITPKLSPRHDTTKPGILHSNQPEPPVVLGWPKYWIPQVARVGATHVTGRCFSKHKDFLAFYVDVSPIKMLVIFQRSTCHRFGRVVFLGGCLYF